MTAEPKPSLRDLWRAGETTLGAWASVGNSITAEMLARSGVSYVCCDAQHGLVDFPDAVSMFQAILAGGSRPIARVAWNEPGRIGKMLDAGAEGVIVPMVNTAEEAEAAVDACRYPPRGGRSYGPSAVAARTNGSYFEDAADQVAVIPMIETAEAVGNLDAILAVPGIDAIYVGPADLSISLGLPPANNDGEPAFDDALRTILAACEARGIVAGIHSSGQLTPRRLAAGFRMVTVTADLVAMRSAVAAELALARRELSADETATDASDLY